MINVSYDRDLSNIFNHLNNLRCKRRGLYHLRSDQQQLYVILKIVINQIRLINTIALIQLYCADDPKTPTRY